MSLSIRNNINGELLEKVITNNDLGGLSSYEKVQHIKNVCESLGLNPLTKPIQLIKFQGKEIAYFTKDATEQLRKNNNISIKIRDTKIVEGIYIVIVDAKTPEGREDSSTGAITISGLKGDALCNAMLKAETKAKRRVTLSICGLGFTDESEIETMKGAKRIDIEEIKSVPHNETLEQSKLLENISTDYEDQLKLDFSSWQFRIEAAPTINDLKEVWTDLKLSDMRKLPDLYKELKDLIESCKLKLIKNTGEE